MVNWMVEVITAYELDERTLFLSVAIMDLFTKQYINKNDRCVEDSDIYLIGITSMLIASKY